MQFPRKPAFVGAIWAAALLGALASVPARSDSRSTATDPARFADEIFRLTNEVRRQYGLTAFRRDVRLDRAASHFSRYMAEANFFGHVGPNGVPFTDRIA